MKGYFTKKEQIVLLFVVLIVILFTGFKLISNNILQAKEEPLELLNTEIISQERSGEIEDFAEADTTIMVHISGQVYYPGLIELKLGSRVNDAIDLAGGLKKEADIDKINLAKKLNDEEKIYVPEKGEEIDIEIASVSGDITPTTDSKININICSKEELMNLSGIGEVTASKIIDYRSKNQFKNIEDMMNVSGIGEKKFEAIKDHIIVR